MFDRADAMELDLAFQPALAEHRAAAERRIEAERVASALNIPVNIWDTMIANVGHTKESHDSNKPVQASLTAKTVQITKVWIHIV